MANSEIKAALRTFYRERSYAIINLAGLSLAIACCLILGLYLKSELTYDMHHKRHKEIFRVVGEYITSGNASRFAVTPVPLGPMLKENYPEVKDYVRFSSLGRVLIRSDQKALYWDNLYAADPNVFDIFTHKILYGDPKTALLDPSSAAVSETFAKKYFGDANPIGKTIHAEIAPEIPRKITLVFRDLPENTHLKYHVLFHFDGHRAGQDQRWNLFNIGLYTYLVMPENYNVKNFKAISTSFYDRFMADFGKQLGQSWDCWLQPLTDIHLHSDITADLPTGNRYYIYGFTVVAVFILLVACINYVNLAIARAAKRAKEIGMRKILGISRMLLISRFLGEAVLFSLIAMVIGAAIVEVVLKLTPVNELLGKPLTLGLKGEPMLLLWMLGLSLLVGLLSGLYPALYLSSISPLSALAGSPGKGVAGFRLRELLVLTQFTVAVIVIACTLIMAMQMRFVSQKDLGFEKHNRVIISLRGLELIEKYQVLKNDLMKDSRITGVSISDGVIGMEQFSVLNSLADSENGPPGRVIISNMSIGDNFPEVMGMKLVQGRSFSKKLITDVGASLLVNEALVKNRGWKNPLGKRIQMGTNVINGKVIGVLKDFHVKSLHSAVEPFVFYQYSGDFTNIPPEVRAAIQYPCTIGITGEDVQQTLTYLQGKFAQYDPKHPFEYKFLDDMLDKQYLPEERLMKMTGIFSAICIFIACMGLFGLAAFTTEQRSKEIGIRKALGASASQIILMLSRKILLLVLVGAIVASIIAYYAIEEWLAGFAYRVGINPLVFVVSTILVLLVAFVTVSLQSYKTAQANPALMMRYE
ncbi:MAG TPA: FtsX-like permease family protein [Acidobacteriota bacterium]|nr:FtsX-like permease family protein [Acidobacteriota bacterium]